MTGWPGGWRIVYDLRAKASLAVVQGRLEACKRDKTISLGRGGVPDFDEPYYKPINFIVVLSRINSSALNRIVVK